MEIKPTLKTVRLSDPEVVPSLIGPLTMVNGIPYNIVGWEENIALCQQCTNEDVALLFRSIRSKGQNPESEAQQ